MNRSINQLLSTIPVHPAALESSLLQRARRFARMIGILEGWLAVLFTAVITLLGSIGPITLTNWRHHTPLQRGSMLFWTLCWITLDLPYQIRLFMIAARQRKPIAYRAAIESPTFPMVLRPIVALWWLTHFAIGAIAEATLHLNGIKSGEIQCNDVFLAFGMGLAANGYLMLAACAATKSSAMRLWVWKYRLLLDLALGFTAAILVQL